MRYLLDTHALIWWLADSRHLARDAHAAIKSGESDIYVSAASAWEITTKHRLGKLSEAETIAHDILNVVTSEGFHPLPISLAQAAFAGRLEGQHRDPFDRTLIAQALLENLTIISNETRFDAFGVSRLW